MTEDISKAHIAEQIYNKSWEELEVIEFNDRLLLPDKIYKRKVDGSVEGIPVMLRIPREPDIRKARVRSRKICDDAGLERDLDSDLYEQMETLCLLSDCIRNTTPPHEEFEPFVEALEKNYDLQSLVNVYGKIDTFASIMNPHPSELSEKDCWALVGAMAEAGNILPLIAYAPASQGFLLTFMADRLVNSQEYKSYLASLEESIQESSAQKNSDES